MLKHQRKPISLSLISTDLPVWSGVDTFATFYQRDRDRFHLLLSEPPIIDPIALADNREVTTLPAVAPPRLLWLEIAPSRVIMTMQGNGKFSYRHLWERGVYGVSRYWLQGDSLRTSSQLRLRNYTRSLALTGTFAAPQHLRVEYELWATKVQLGRYVLDVEIH